MSAFQIVLKGDVGWIVDNDRGTVAGASLHDGEWTTWTPPCQDRPYGDAELAGIGTYDLVAFCPPNLVVSTPPPAALFTSTNGGLSFQEVATTLPSSVGGLAAAPSGALFCYDGQGIAGSFNDGRTWQTVLGLGPTPAPVPNTGFAFVTSTVGFAVTPRGQPRKRLTVVTVGNRWHSLAKGARNEQSLGLGPTGRRASDRREYRPPESFVLRGGGRVRDPSPPPMKRFMNTTGAIHEHPSLRCS